jgi:hypothetical protein
VPGVLPANPEDLIKDINPDLGVPPKVEPPLKPVAPFASPNASEPKTPVDSFLTDIKPPTTDVLAPVPPISSLDQINQVAPETTKTPEDIFKKTIKDIVLSGANVGVEGKEEEINEAVSTLLEAKAKEKVTSS